MTNTAPITVEFDEAIFQEVANILESVITDFSLDFALSPETIIQSDLDLESFDIVRFGLALSERYGQAVNLSSYLSELDFHQATQVTLGDISRYVAQRTLPRKD